MLGGNVKYCEMTDFDDIKKQVKFNIWLMGNQELISEVKIK